MAIVRVQKNGLITASGTTGTCPAWGTPTTAGNLLLILINELGAFTGTWNATPAGYTAFAPTPSIYWTTTTDPHGIYWKIATGSDATPGNIGADSGSGGPWVIYTVEYSSPNGWATTPNDAHVESPAGSTAVATKASGTSGTLAQSNELALALGAFSVVVTGLTFSNGYNLEGIPTGGDGTTQFAWQETASTAALSTTASWTTNARPGIRIASFKTGAAAAAAGRSDIMVVRRVGCGA